MKKPLIILLLTLSSIIWSYDLTLTQEKISVREYSQEEFQKNFDTDFIPGVVINSNIDDITALINGEKFRSDRLFLSEATPGNYHIKLSKSGYKPAELWITYKEGSYIFIDVTLERERGYLRIDTTLENYEVYLNSVELDLNNPLPTGAYKITLKSFGYEEETSLINIFHNTTTLTTYSPEKVEFKLEKVSLNKEIINPLAKGAFNRLEVKISVNGPGSAILEFIDRDNSILETKEIKFTTWDTNLTLNGYINGRKLDNGNYKIRIKTGNKSLSKAYSVDDTLYLSKMGLTLSETGEYYNLSLYQTGFSVGRDFVNSKTDISLTHTASSYTGLGLFGKMDLSLYNNGSLIDLKGGLYKGINLGITKIKPELTYIFNLETLESSNKVSHSIGFNTPVTISPGNFGITLNPGVLYTIDGDFYTTASFGLDWDNQLIKAGVSGDIKTTDFNDLNFRYSGEINYLLSNSQAYIGLSTIGDIDLNFLTSLSMTLLY